MPLFLEIVTEITTDITADLEEGLSEIADLPTSAEEVSTYLQKLYSMLEELAVTYGGKLVISLLLIIIGFKIVNRLTGRISKSKAMSRIDTTTQSFLGSVLSIVFKVLIGMTAAAILGIPMSSMIAVIGSCGLAIGLALQGSLSNIAGGFIILILKPFSVGDYIIATGMEGTVEDIGIFHTKIITNDNKRIIVPNSTISNATLTNVTAMSRRRVDFTFTASYNADIDKVERVLLDTCDKHELIFKDPAPFAHLSGHGDSALEYTVRVWCKAGDYWTVYYDMLKNVKNAFDAEGIEIPYPQLDVHSTNA